MTEGVSVKIGADTSGLEAGVARSKSQLNSLSTEMKGVVTNVAALTAAAFAAGSAMVVGLAAQGMEAVDAQAKLARQLGGTVTGLRALEGAAGDAGVSSEAMASAMQRLNRTIGNAQAGSKPAIEAFDRLGLSAENLAGMDVDQRMAAIADAVKNSGMNAQQAASALAAMGIKQSEIINLAMQGGDAIRAEADTVAALGLSISEIDAAKIEAANDAMGVFGDIMTGVRTQLAVEVAPIITALATMLEDTAKEAGGVGEATSEAFGYIVESVAFVIDAVDGIKRAFELVADGVIIAFSAIAGTISSAIANVLRVAGKIPGVDFSEAVASLEDFSAQSDGVITAAWGNINETLNEPLAGDNFKKFVAEARVAGEAAAKAVVEGRNAVLGGGVTDTGNASDPATVDTGDADAQKKFAADIAAWNAKNAAELEAVKARFVTEEELMRQHRELMNIIGEEFDAEKFESEEQWRSISEQAEAEHQAKLTAITGREAEARKKVLGDALRGLTTLMNSESRKMFEIGKAAAISQSVISTYQGMNKALELGWPLGPIAAAAIGAAGFANVQSINSQSFGSGGGAAGSVTDQINSNSGTVSQQGGQQQTGGTYRFEGLSAGSFVSSDMVVEMLKQAQKDGALRGQLEFA